MTMQVPDEAMRARRDEWVAAAQRLVGQIEQWCRELGWSVQRDDIDTRERLLGTYRVPVLRARMPSGGELHVTPVALHVVGANGRVDIESWPSLNRVKLVRRNGDEWEVWTDSNVPLREPWNRDTFAVLAQDLAAPV